MRASRSERLYMPISLPNDFLKLAENVVTSIFSTSRRSSGLTLSRNTMILSIPGRAAGSSNQHSKIRAHISSVSPRIVHARLEGRGRAGRTPDRILSMTDASRGTSTNGTSLVKIYGRKCHK